MRKCNQYLSNYNLPYPTCRDSKRVASKTWGPLASCGAPLQSGDLSHSHSQRIRLSIVSIVRSSQQKVGTSGVRPTNFLESIRGNKAGNLRIFTGEAGGIGVGWGQCLAEEAEVSPPDV